MLISFRHTNRRTLLYLVALVLVVSLGAVGCIRKVEPPTTFYGLKPPGPEPVRFAADVLSAELRPHGPLCFSTDGQELYFSGYRIGGGRDETIYRSAFNGKSLQPPTRAAFAAESGFGPTCLTINGQQLFLGANLPKPGPDEPACFGIWYVDRTDDGWGEMTPVMPTLDTGWFAGRPAVARSGNLYFVARRYSGGDPWLYCSQLVDGEYTTPEPLGVPINTTVAADPYIDPDEKFLLFMSQGRQGEFGRSDLYVSFRDDTDSWGEPINLGPTINTENFERSPSLSPDGKYLFFIRAAGDLYVESDAHYYWMSAEILDSLRP